MKILFVVSTYYPEGAGSGRSVRNLAEGVVKAGHEAVVVRLTDQKKTFTETLNGVKIYYLPIRNFYFLGGKQRPAAARMAWHAMDMFNPFAAWDFYKILKSERPDIINTNVIAGFSTSIFYVAKWMKIKLVHTMRDYYLMCSQNAMFNNGKNCEAICTKCKPFFSVRKAAAKRVDMFLSNSAFVEQRHKSLGFLNDNQTTNVQFNMNDGDDIRPAQTLNKNKTIRFGYIGRLSEVKGIDVLLEATQKLETENWTLKIAGKGPDDFVQNLQTKFSDKRPNKRIEYIGFTDPDAFYEEIDILICPSVYGEPLPRVVYEAYRAAIPVIAAATGGTPEIIDHGECGFTYDARDHNALAGLMDRVAGDAELYKKLSKGAAQKAEIFTQSVITAQFLERIETVLKDKGAQS